MAIDKEDFQRYFSEGNEVASGGGRKSFIITEILDDRARIQPTESKTASRLGYDKLSVVVDNFDEVNPKRIERTVGELLSKYGLIDTQNESYLYGMAIEYKRRKGTLRESFIKSQLDNEIIKSRKLSSSERKSKIKLATKNPNKFSVIRTEYHRNPDVVAEGLERANGICEKCSSPAPFNRAKDGSPYLEVHHIKQLAHGGEDTVKNTIAVCPNCHREAHFGIKA